QPAFRPRCMITLPALAADALGSFLASDMKDRFGSSHTRLAELIPFAARLALECIGNSDALYHNVEHTMLVTLARHHIFKRRALGGRGGGPSAEGREWALSGTGPEAPFDGRGRAAHARGGALDDRLYLDLGDKAWRAVEISAAGWRVIANPPVRFRRAGGMQPLPVPVAGGSGETLRSFLNVRSDTGFVLVGALALAVFATRGPDAVVALSGEQGSAKSTFSAILRALLDPNTAPLRALPREDRDLFIAATNGHLLAFDNVSGLPAWISDTLCRLATGGGFAVRQLYTDQDEGLFHAARPVILNGIEDIVARPDLADRAVFLTLEPIPEDRRR